MTKNRIILLHVLAWVLIITYDLVGVIFFENSGGLTPFPKVPVLLQVSMTLSMFGVFYYCYLLILPGIINKRTRYFALAGAVFSPLVFVIIRYLLEENFYPLVFGFSNYWGDYTLRYYVLDNIYRGLPSIAIAASVWGILRAFEQEKENKQLREEKIKAELAFLKSQINPHFLYNTLNYIYSLAYPVSDKLADAIIKLSQLMRYMLTESPDGLIDLEKEVDYLENYIDIYRLRFEDNFHVDFKAEGDIAGKRLASLVLIPFVENAFKHGAVEDPQRPVRIHLKVIANRLMFTVSNKISHRQKDHSSGVGLVNIRRRLALIYPGKHDLLISENGQTYKTTLNIEL